MVFEVYVLLCRMLDKIADFYYSYLYGEWESMKLWLWIYGHVSILFATGLAGFTLAHQEYVMTALLVPFPMVYLYKRFEKAKTYKVQSDTPV